MKRLILALCLLLPGVALAQVSIPSGSTAHYVPFIAVDSTDKVTRETGLSSFTVYRKRENGTLTAMTTPTVVEDSSSNAPGVYRLLLDEDTTIGAGNDTEVMTLHITHAGMEPVTMTVNLYRPKLTAGQTLTISGGSANAAVQSVASNAINRAAFDDDTNGMFGIVGYGTAQSATSTSLTLANGAVVKPGWTLNIIGGSAGIGEAALVTEVSGSGTSTPVATISGWAGGVTPTGTIGYVAFGSAPGEGGDGGGLDAEGIRDAIGLASANLDTQLSTIDGNVDSILADTGTDGVVVASGSKTGYSIGSGGITSASFANDSITAAAAASDFGAEIRTGLATGTNLTALQGDVTTLLSRLTSTRGGYLDKLNITGDVASATALQTVDDVVDALQVILDKLDTAMEADGEEYRFTANALEQAPAGEGGGTNITQIKGRDAETVLDERVAAQLVTYDPPTRAELTSDIESVLTGITGVPAAVWNVVIEDQGGGIIARCAMAANLAYAAGDLATTGSESTYEDPSGTETRITATVTSAGNRLASVTCPSY